MGLFDIFKISEYKQEIANLKQQNQALQNNLDSLGYKEYAQVQEVIANLKIEANNISTNLAKSKAHFDATEQDYKNRKEKLQQDYIEYEKKISEQRSALSSEIEKVNKKLKTATNKLNKSKELYSSIQYAIETFFNYEPSLESLKLTDSDLEILQELSPSVTLKLHYMDVKSLRKSFRENDKLIEKLLTQYEGRYTTKANKAIYDLMVIALRAELQNVLYNLKYEKLEDGISQIKEITQKYLDIASKGNQNIAGTLTKFIGEIEYLFINAVKIEYNYYVKKEQARQEQLAIREQMRQEAEERKALEQEKKKIENEELKYNKEIEKLKAQLQESADKDKALLDAKILELEAKLSEVVVKKDNITQLQNGKAGNVYVISNLGSFGENVFKVGMTRRINPQDRVNELGDASVPFKFDVHSFIFSEDAVGLEKKLHDILNSKRVNKVNLRKEFFYSTIDELETLVNEIEPTAEFNKTMLAEEFRQSLSSEEVYTSELSDEDEDE